MFSRLWVALWARRYDLCGLAGAAVVGGGVWAIYRPAGVIVWGLALLGWALVGARVEAHGRVT